MERDELTFLNLGQSAYYASRPSGVLGVLFSRGCPSNFAKPS
jgi:hypothetical protein